MSGSTTTKSDEDGGTEPDELGIRMMEHGDCVSITDLQLFKRYLNPRSHFILQMRLGVFGLSDLKQVGNSHECSGFTASYNYGFLKESTSLGSKTAPNCCLKIISDTQPLFVQMRM